MKTLINIYLSIYHYWLRLPEQIRFILVGGYNTFFSYCLYAFFLFLSDNQLPQIALFLSFILSSVNSYLTQKFYVFNTRGNYIKEFIGCITVWSLSYFFNIVLLWATTTFWIDNPYIAQIICLILIAVLNYICLKQIAFKKTVAEKSHNE
ncbi:MAG: GtrA family protein [Alphaproteobacteria bacterium]|nr:GtrA family protein [Alphaproteobacteria bacterium]